VERVVLNALVKPLRLRRLMYSRIRQFLCHGAGGSAFFEEGQPHFARRAKIEPVGALGGFASFFRESPIKDSACVRDADAELGATAALGEAFLWSGPLSPDETINRSPVSAAKFLERFLRRWRVALRLQHYTPVRCSKGDCTVLCAQMRRTP